MFSCIILIFLLICFWVIQQNIRPERSGIRKVFYTIHSFIISVLAILFVGCLALSIQKTAQYVSKDKTLYTVSFIDCRSTVTHWKAVFVNGKISRITTGIGECPELIVGDTLPGFKIKQF